MRLKRKHREHPLRSLTFLDPGSSTGLKILKLPKIENYPKLSTPDLEAKIVEVLKGPNGKKSMAKICRAINREINPEVERMLYCGLRRCGFANIRKRAKYEMRPHRCLVEYRRVMSTIRKMRFAGKVRVKTGTEFDKFVRGGDYDFRRFVELPGEIWSRPRKKRIKGRGVESLLGEFF